MLNGPADTVPLSSGDKRHTADCRRHASCAWRALRTRSLNMDVPISLGVTLAFGMSLVETINHAEHAYFDSAVMLLFFLLVGRTLDHAMRRKTRAIAGNLAALRADTAHRFSGDELVNVPVPALTAGDRLLVKPGERVPADGMVIGGSSELDGSAECEVFTRNVSTASAICFRHGKRFEVIAITQKLRPDAVDVATSLRERGLVLHILSGDRDDAVKPVAAALGISSWHGGLKPADKIARRSPCAYGRGRT